MAILRSTTGSDGGDLFQAAENRFQIRLSAEQRSGFSTIGQLVDAVTENLPANGSACWSSRAFFRLREALVKELDQPRQFIHPSTSLDELLPKQCRHRHWTRLTAHLGLRVPRLRRPVALVLVFVLAVTALFIGVLIAYHAFFAALLLAALLAAIARIVTTPLATRFPERKMTVGDLVYRLVYLHPEEFPTAGRTSKKAVWRMLRLLIADELGVTLEQLDLNLRFHEDLNVDW